jgi:hypothetical protein
MIAEPKKAKPEAEPAAEPKKIGRPKGSKSSDRDDMIRVRCNRAQREAFEQLGGADWLRELIDKKAKRL